MLTYFGLRLGLILAWLTPQKFFVAVFTRLGEFAARFQPGRRELVARNLAVLVGEGTAPPPERVFASYARYWGELLALAARPRRLDRLQFRVEGLEHLEAAQAAGSLCLISGHLGNWDLLGAWTRRHLPELTVPAEALKPRTLFDLFVTLRRRLGVRVLETSGPGLPLFRLFKEGRPVGMIVDRVVTGDEEPGGDFEKEAGDWRPQPFLGGWRRFPAAGMDLARRAGATLMPIFILREGPDYAIKICPPLPPGEDPLAAFARVLEDEVRQRPEQWCLLYPVHDAEGAQRGLQADTAKRAVSL